MKPEPTETASLDEPPVAALYDRYAAVILAYLCRHCAAREDAEDVLLDVFVAALEYDRLTEVPEARRLPWLLRVARHKLVDHYRRAQRRPALALDEVAEAVEADERLAPEQRALQQEAEDRVRGAIQRLPALQQEILLLRFVAGLRSAEIAQALGKRHGAVRMQLSRALNRLRALYAEEAETKKEV